MRRKFHFIYPGLASIHAPSCSECECYGSIQHGANFHECTGLHKYLYRFYANRKHAYGGS